MLSSPSCLCSVLYHINREAGTTVRIHKYKLYNLRNSHDIAFLILELVSCYKSKLNDQVHRGEIKFNTMPQLASLNSIGSFLGKLAQLFSPPHTFLHHRILFMPTKQKKQTTTKSFHHRLPRSCLSAIMALLYLQANYLIIN